MSDEDTATAADGERPAPAPDFLSRLHKQVLLLTMLTTNFTLSAGRNPPDPSLSESDNGGAPLSGVLLSLCCGSTAFVASLVLLLFLLLPRNTLRVKYRALQVAMTMNLLAMIGGGAYLIGSYRAIYVIALVAAVLLYICIQLQLIFWSKRPEHVDAQPPEYADAQRQDSSSRYLLLLATLVVTITYQAGMNPPGGFWRDDAADARHDHVAGDSTINSIYSRRHLVFFYCNATVFFAALAVTLILLLSNVFNLLLTKRTKHLASQSALTLKLFGLTGAYAAGSCRELPEFIYISVLGVPVFFYVAIHVMVFMTQVFPVTWRQVLRDKVDQGVPGWLKKPFELPGEEEGEKKSSKLLLLLAILATSLTYHDGISSSCDNLVNHQAFFYCNTTAFVGSLAIITLLMNKKAPATGIRWHALRVCVVLDVIGLTGAFAAGGYRKTSTIDVLVLVLAVLLCIVFHVALAVSGTARGLVQGLVSMLGSPDLLVGAEEEDGSEDEMEFGIAGGTDEEPLAVEISSPILGGALTMILAVPVMAVLANPVKLLVAIMIASIGVSLWRRSFARLLRALAGALQRRCAVNLQGTPRTGSSSNASSTRREQLVSAICQGLCKVIHTLCVGTWMWLLILVIWVPSLRHNLKLKFKMSKIAAVIGVLVVSGPPTPTSATATTDTPDMAMSTGATSTTTTTTVEDAPSTATSSTVTGNRTVRTAATTASSSRGDRHLVEPRPRRNRRPNSRLIGQDWVN